MQGEEKELFGQLLREIKEERVGKEGGGGAQLGKLV